MASSDDQPRAPAPPGHREVGGGARYTIHAFASPGIGSVNNYWIETRDALIAIDAQRQLSQARLAVDAMRALNKPIRAIFVTHEHPDHFGGLELLVDAAAPDVPIYGAEATARAVAADALGYYKLARDVLRDDFPERPLGPTSFIEHGQTIEIDGLRLTVHEFGPGEASAMTTLLVDDGADYIAADIVANAMTPFVIEGRMLRWMDQLSGFGATLPQVRQAYPGHGNPAAAADLVRAQTAYFTGFRDLVRDGLDAAGDLSPEAAARVAAEVERRHPGWLPVADVPNLLAISATTIAAELKAASA